MRYWAEGKTGPPINENPRFRGFRQSFLVSFYAVTSEASPTGPFSCVPGEFRVRFSKNSRIFLPIPTTSPVSAKCSAMIFPASGSSPNARTSSSSPPPPTAAEYWAYAAANPSNGSGSAGSARPGIHATSLAATVSGASPVSVSGTASAAECLGLPALASAAAFLESMKSLRTAFCWSIPDLVSTASLEVPTTAALFSSSQAIAWLADATSAAALAAAALTAVSASFDATAATRAESTPPEFPLPDAGLSAKDPSSIFPRAISSPMRTRSAASIPPEAARISSFLTSFRNSAVLVSRSRARTESISSRCPTRTFSSSARASFLSGECAGFLSANSLRPSALFESSDILFSETSSAASVIILSRRSLRILAFVAHVSEPSDSAAEICWDRRSNALVRSPLERVHLFPTDTSSSRRAADSTAPAVPSERAVLQSLRTIPVSFDSACAAFEAYGTDASASEKEDETFHTFLESPMKRGSFSERWSYSSLTAE